MSTVFITKTARAHPVVSRLALNKRAWVRVCDSAPASANRQKEVEERCQSEFASNRVPHFPIASAQSANTVPTVPAEETVFQTTGRARARIFPPTPYQLPAAMTEWLRREGGPSLPGAKSPSIPAPLLPSLFPPLLNMIASTRDGTDNERKVSRCMTCCRAATLSRPKSTRGLQSLFRQSFGSYCQLISFFPSFGPLSLEWSIERGRECCHLSCLSS